MTEAELAQHQLRQQFRDDVHQRQAEHLAQRQRKPPAETPASRVTDDSGGENLVELAYGGLPSGYMGNLFSQPLPYSDRMRGVCVCFCKLAQIYWCALPVPVWVADESHTYT